MNVLPALLLIMHAATSPAVATSDAISHGRAEARAVAPEVCTIVHFSPPLVKWDSVLHVEATILPERVPEPRWNNQTVPDHEGLLRFWPRGQVARIRDIDHGPARGVVAGVEIVVFRWSLGQDCNWTPKRDSLPPGTEHYLTLIPRPDSLRVGGLPTYDAGPFTPDAFPGPSGADPELSLALYREFMHQQPTESEWRSECRRPVRRVERWIERHPTVAEHPRISGALRQRYHCNHRLYGYLADDYIRWDDVDAAPAEIEAWALATGCEPLWDEPGERFAAVPGEFTGTGLDEWALLCDRDGRWALQVVAFDDPARVVEIVSMVGDPTSWYLVAADPRVFELLTAVEFREDPGRERPRRDVVLLHQSTYERIVALYHTPEGWRSARVRCCHWPDGW